MYKRSLLLLLACWSCQALAEEWQVIATTKLGLLRMDKENISRGEKYTKAVINYEFEELQKIAVPPYKVFNRRQDDVLVDCKGLTLGAIARRFYKDGELVSDYQIAAANVKFVASKPDTMAKQVIDAVCAAVPVSKP